MLTLNNQKFALNDEEFISSLFEGKNTCVGYYRVLKNKVKLFDMQNNLVGVITKHKVLLKATLQENGKFWYSFGDIDLIGKYDDYKHEQDDIREALLLIKHKYAQTNERI